MKNYYKKSPDESLEVVGVTSKGLSEEEIIKRREQYGFNELEEGAKKVLCRFF